MSIAITASPPDVFARVMPLLFVGIWATGFIVARLVAPHADPMTFLGIRFALTSAAFAVLATAAGAAWPRNAVGWRNALVSGVLMQGIFLGGVFWSVRHGLPAGISALVTGLQPLLTAALSGWLLGEVVRRTRWIGIALGFAGALLVLQPQLAAAGSVGLVPMAVSGLSMLSITLGTIWQKRTGAAGDLRIGASIQFLGAAAVIIPVALLTEQGRFDGTWEAWVGLAWAVCGLSLGAGSLLILLIRRGAVAGVASLFYLVPPVVAGIAWFAFADQLSVLQVAGMAVAAAGVALASRN